MERVLLISEQTIKSESVLETNVDPKILSKVIINVQEIQLKAILGTTLYNALISQVKSKILDSSFVMSSYNLQLLNDYVIPFLTHATVSEFIVVNNYKLSNKGVMKLTDNASASSNPQDIEYVKNYYDSYAAVYKSRLVKFLKADNDSSTGGTDSNNTSSAIGCHLESGQGDFIKFNI